MPPHSLETSLKLLPWRRDAAYAIYQSRPQDFLTLILVVGCDSNLGLEMIVSIEMLIVELGVSVQPFQESFNKYKDWVTWSCIVSLCEKCDMFNVVIHLNDNFFRMPREGDKWIMQLFTRVGFNKEDLLRLNRVCVHQQVLFLYSVLGASGKSLDKKYMTKRNPEEKWSTLRFPKEKPPNKDFQLWRMALRQIVPAGGIPDRLGRLTHSGYKIWN